MPITATIDRFEGDIAVLEVEPERTKANVPRSDLPQDAAQGDVVRLEGTVDREETEMAPVGDPGADRASQAAWWLKLTCGRSCRQAANESVLKCF